KENFREEVMKVIGNSPFLPGAGMYFASSYGPRGHKSNSSKQFLLNKPLEKKLWLSATVKSYTHSSPASEISVTSDSLSAPDCKRLQIALPQILAALPCS